MSSVTLNLHAVPAEQFSPGCRPLTINEANLHRSHKHPRVQVRILGGKNPHRWGKWHSAYIDTRNTYQTDLAPCG